MRKIVFLGGALCAAVGATTVKATALNGTVLFPMLPPAGYPTVDLDGIVVASSGQAVADATSGANSIPVLWNGTSGAINLKPTNLSGIGTTEVGATDGVQQVGDAAISSSVTHAILWNGSPSSAIDLNPAQYTSTSATAVSHGLQVGLGYTTASTYLEHALLWAGSASSVVDLTPSGFGDSVALGTDGIHEVGWASTTDISPQNAMLWTGSASGVVNLQNSRFLNSLAYGVGGNEQVGTASVGTNANSSLHAVMWSGSASTAVDLNPIVGGSSQGSATNGFVQVGSAYVGNYPEAYEWAGSAASAVDLQSLLPSAGSWVQSSAYAVDQGGTAFGVALGTYNGTTGLFAVQWSVVPEPSLPLGVSIAAILFARYWRPSMR